MSLPNPVEVEKAKTEARLRKKVFEVIQDLMEEVDEQKLTGALPYLDFNSWNEAVEERYLASLCGLPTCSRAVQQAQTHKYHIDRKSNKIYETCTERGKFCGTVCFDAATAIRVQLDTEPLWITGEAKRRMGKKYVVERPKRMIEEVEDEGGKEEQKTPQKPRKAPLSPYSVEVVGDNLMAAMNDLKIAEREASSAEESDSEEDDVSKSVPLALDDELKAEIAKDDNEFRQSMGRFLSGQRMSCSKSMAEDTPSSLKPAKSSAPKPSSPSTKLVLSSEEQAKLDRIRQKYSRKEQLRPPILIEAPKLSARKVKETNKAEVIVTSVEMGADGEHVSVSASKEKPIVGDPSVLVTPCTKDDIDFVLTTMRQWWTERSRNLLVSGGLRPSNDIDRMMRLFLAGEKGADIELEDVQLPDSGIENVARRRLQILINTLRPSWQSMERRLNVGSSQMQSVSSLLGTFSLTAENIADFERQHTRLLTAVIFRILCRFTEELEDSFFPGGYLSKEICGYLEFCGVEEHVFSRLCDEVLRLTN